MPRTRSDTTELKKYIKELEALVHSDGIALAKVQKMLYRGIKEVREGITNNGLDNWADQAESVLNSIKDN